ncbi:MAG: DUF1800 domain-containing protein [Dehalococcoidia bacterium]
MDEQPHPPGLFERKATRRALLAGGATAAAGAAAVAVAGFATRSGGDNNSAKASTGEAEAPTPLPAIDLSKVPIAEPRRRAAHLLRRAGFGGTAAEIDAFATLSREEAADRLLNYETTDNSALDARLARMNLNLKKAGTPPAGQGNINGDMQRWWMARMAYTARPLEERMTLIWHGLLTSQVSKINGERAKLMVLQNELFRAHALGRYDDLLQAVSKDTAMLIYLDTDQSTKEHPNENYARELMELFSMGVGNYTEDDVRESARAFTGWRFTPPDAGRPNVTGLSQAELREIRTQAIADWEPRFVVNARLHDTGTKSFLGRRGNFSGEDIVAIIMEQPATAKFITRRLFTEFANFNPSDETLARLVEVWNSSAHSVRDVVRAILVSDEFYSEASYRGFVRSPIEFMIGMVRALEIETDFRPMLRNPGRQGGQGAGGLMGQVLFEPPNVAGWAGGANWLSSSTFFARVNFLDSFLFTQQGRANPIPALVAATTAEDCVDRTLDRLVDGNVAAGARDALIAYARGITNPQLRAAGIAYLVLGSPEYQLV